MKLLTYKLDGSEKEYIGVQAPNDSGKIIPLAQFGEDSSNMTEFIRRADESRLAQIRESISHEGCEVLDKNEVIKCAPIIYPAQDIICLGINYIEHAKESARFKKEAFGGPRQKPVYFSKRVDRALADGEMIQAHTDIVDSLDYESELAVIIGKDAKNVSKESAFDFIFGYTIMNDVSARTLQTSHKQWYFGKGLDGFTPMGPCIVTKDEFKNPPCLAIKSYVNGEIRQDSNTELLLTGIAEIIVELSTGMTLKAGTIISTGTPKGVGMGFVPPKWLKPGDEVVCEIEGIGRLTNIVSE